MMKNIASSMSPLFTAAGTADLEKPSDTEIVPISRTIGPEQLLDEERPSAEETPSDSGRETTAPPSGNVTEEFRLDEQVHSEADFEGIIGKCSTLRRLLELVKTVAPSNSTVLLLGETGTGKELIARAIHNLSRREDRT